MDLQDLTGTPKSILVNDYIPRILSALAEIEKALKGARMKGIEHDARDLLVMKAYLTECLEDAQAAVIAISRNYRRCSNPTLALTPEERRFLYGIFGNIGDDSLTGI